MAEHYSSFDRTGWRWLLQPVTAVFLIGTLAFQFILLQFVNYAAEVSFAGTNARMDELVYFSLTLTFPVTATFYRKNRQSASGLDPEVLHRVNGVYNGLVNVGLEGRQKKIVAVVLVVARITLVVQGVRVALAVAGI